MNPMVTNVLLFIVVFLAGMMLGVIIAPNTD